MMDANSKYLNDFEQRVMIPGIEKGLFKSKKEGTTIVPLRRRKLNGTPFALFIGDKFEYDGVLAFNYYGLFKLSSGTIRVVKENITAFPNIRTIQSRVLHFNSIKLDHIKELAPDLLEGFPGFKQFLVGLRNF